MERGWRLDLNADSGEIYSHVRLGSEEDAVELIDRVLCDRDSNGHAYGYGNGICKPAKLVPVSFLSPAVAATSPPPLGFIEHPVSKYDTLAGVAIKYGVEVADIKKMNGLVTDLQMFALKTLKIPLPGRHLPAASLSNDSNSPGESSCAWQKHDDLLESFQSLKVQPTQRKVSAAMSSLQGNYGLKPTEQKPKSASFDMGTVDHLGNETSARFSSITNAPLNHHRKTRSFVNCLDENGEPIRNLQLADPEDDRQIEKLIRRRQKSENDFNCQTPVKLLKEESSSSSSSSSSSLISPITGKSLAQRPKAAARNTSADSDAGTAASGESSSGDGLGGVKRSSSTSNIQDQDNGTSLWFASKLKLKRDLQAFSTAAIAIPIFDGLPPIPGRKNKAAID